jgi:N-succinyl-L-ornithine transcarbamylase
MKLFSSVNDISNLKESVNQALMLKADPFSHQNLGKNKTLGLVFLNPSLRTRLSTQKAALNLGMNVMVMNLDKEGWALETEDGVVMNGTTVEHIREAAAVMGQYCDILGFRSFPKLQDREEDYSEGLFNKFVKFSGVPVISLESATLHPLQSFADLITIEENKNIARPKVVLTWAPHVKSLPQAVPNSFSEWMCRAQAEGMIDFVITHPEGLELADKFTSGAKIEYDQDTALQGADFVYAKNWSSYTDYGKTVSDAESWMITHKKLEQTNEAKVMHCLPVRRDFELSAEVLDGPHSLVIKEAANRVWSAQMILKSMLEGLK